MKFPKILLAALIVLLPALAPASTSEGEKRLKIAVEEAMAAAKASPNVTVLRQNLKPILQRHLSFDLMTKRAVGPGWRQFAEAQQSQAIDLFSTLILRTYSSRFTPGIYPSVEFKTAVSPKPGLIEVPTVTTYEGNQYNVTYRLEEASGWRVTDVLIEGVSLVRNYRTQFEAEFLKNGVAGVLNALNQSVNKPQ